MIPQSWPSRINKIPLLEENEEEELVEVDATFETIYLVKTLEDVEGLTRWVDYIPVQVVEPENLNSFGNDDAIYVEETDGEHLVDCIYVYEEGDVPFSANNNGYIPIYYLGN